MPIAAVTVALALAASAPPVESDCSGSTLEVDACAARVLSDVEAEHLRYAQAARARLKEEARQAGPGERGVTRAIRGFDKAEVAWALYRDAECGAVYDWYSAGTIRGGMALSCRLRLTRARTYAIWREWLTYPDSTPPILPEPAAEPVERR